jgi:GNAT superfamily N-acetyltransferase
MLTIQPVRTDQDRRRFIRLARSVYPTASPWVRPLDSALADYLSPYRNPLYRDAQAEAFLALRGGRPVGRVLALVWRRHQRLHGERVGYFCFFECLNDPEASSALLEAASEFVRRAGCTSLRGPFNMTAAQEMGVVVAGFEQPPSVDMVYTPPWYPPLLEAAGFRPCLSMQTWRNDAVAALDAESLLSPQLRERQKSLGLSLRPIRGRRRDEDLEYVRELTNAAFLGNWSFVPITREEWQLQVGPVAPLLDPALVILAEVQGVPVGVTFAAPNFNEMLRRVDGTLLHPAALSLLKQRSTDEALVILFAVRKQYQGLGVSRLLNADLVRALQRRGYRSLSITWIAASNVASRRQAEALGMRPLHDLAMYEKPLPS